ncbi:hypothetical protein ACYT84_22400 [Ralstonia solanacearum]|uniref:hypothetical protein n=1 Tax=Ralstonia solanacearum TaxID=305 RepID=UPI0018D10AC2|nr:hypothetical protein [Ralstonia solanacearum]MDB0568711.1 hypothetical protein [Ralstonia solanacearum]MDB0578608.1 hypothetical protein [Ralstonia solanacearum]
MLPSLHDCYLASYEVRCSERIIVVRAEYGGDSRSGAGINLAFAGVQAYRFEGDAFGNIILDLEEVPLQGLLEEQWAGIAESYRMSGAPGPWAAKLSSAAPYLRELDAKGFVLSSSYGLSGWVIAKDVTYREWRI